MDSVYDDGALPPAGLLHSEIHGSYAYLRLPVAYRSLSRPFIGSQCQGIRPAPFLA